MCRGFRREVPSRISWGLVALAKARYAGVTFAHIWCLVCAHKLRMYNHSCKYILFMITITIPFVFIDGCCVGPLRIRHVLFTDARCHCRETCRKCHWRYSCQWSQPQGLGISINRKICTTGRLFSTCIVCERNACICGYVFHLRQTRSRSTRKRLHSCFGFG